LDRAASRKNTIEDLVSRAIASNGKKAPVALIVSLTRKLHRVAMGRGSDDVDLQPFLAQARECGSRKFCRPAATGGGVDDGEESIHGKQVQIGKIHFPFFSLTSKPALQGQNRGAAVQLGEAFCQDVSFDLERSRPGKVLVQQNHPVDALVV